MDINQLKQFISVAQTMSFTEAAKRNGLSQPTISHSINELEKQLSTKLFVRTKRSVVITDAGKELLPRALEMVDIAENTAFRIRQLESGWQGSISIAALTTSSFVLSKCISSFSEQYPDITIDISFNSGGSQVIALNEARYDVHFAVREMVPVGSDFDSLVSHSDSLCVVFPANHPLANQPLDFARLSGERFVAVSETDGPALYSEIKRICLERGYEPNVVCKCDRVEAALLSVGAGVGISILPEALKRVFYSNNVKFTRIPGVDALRTYVIAWHSVIINPAVKLFIEVVEKLFKNEVVF